MNTELKEKLKKKNIKKKVIGGATAAGLSVSVLLAGLFHSPEELTQKNTQTIRQQETPIVMMMDLDADDADPEADGDENPEEEKKSIFARIKKKILQLPAAIRALVGVPLWAIGWVIIHFLSLAWSTVLHPILGIVLKWVLAALVLLAVYAIVMKCAFPDMPLKKILRPKNILFILIGTAVLGVADWVIPLFWGDYSKFRFVIMLAGGFAVLCAVAIPLIVRHSRKKQASEAFS
ncbi:MAG: hypothetical protein IKZ95_05870 [Lachnospiraceae bacterium]|nr:hypothetical protein [Lachnospiraceae bacterium]